MPGQDQGGNAQKSRSQKKRDSTALQLQGEEIAALAPAARAALPLPPDLAEALSHHDAIGSHEGRRRQRQYIGRLMREMDEEQRGRLLEALDATRGASLAAAGFLREIEARREALLSPEAKEREAALADCLEACPDLERGRLLHLIEAALAERQKNRPPKHARELFRYLRAACSGQAPGA